MPGDLWYPQAVCGLLVALMGVRWYYYFRYPKRGPTRATAGDLRDALLVRLTGLAMFLPPLLYAFRPGLVAFAAWTLPASARWAGLAVSAAGLGLLAWSHHALRNAFSAELTVVTDQKLATGGPYRWVRHPMYLALYVFWVGNLLLAANWLVGGCGLVALSAMLCYRLPREERMMMEAFGDEYRAYAGRTGALLPRWPGTRGG